jgi:hypothetical protein
MWESFGLTFWPIKWKTSSIYKVITCLVPLSPSYWWSTIRSSTGWPRLCHSRHRSQNCWKPNSSSTIWMDVQVSLKPPLIIVEKKFLTSFYGLLFALREKGSFEMRLHEQWRRVDRTSPSSHLTLQSHRRCAAGRIFNYYTWETRNVRACHLFDFQLGPLCH